jgi:hypothetical protein
LEVSPPSATKKVPTRLHFTYTGPAANSSFNILLTLL